MIKVGSRVRLNAKGIRAFSQTRMGLKKMWLNREGTVIRATKRGDFLVIWDGRKSFEPTPGNALEEIK